jgi:hypothetical protein
MDTILKTGDVVTFDTTFGDATIVASPGSLSGSGKFNIGGSAVCIEGDEASVTATCTYLVSSKGYAGGTGTLSISQLADDQVSTKVKSSETGVMLVGSEFEATCTVVTPAFSNSGADENTSYDGTGTFTSTNTSVNASE